MPHPLGLATLIMGCVLANSLARGAPPRAAEISAKEERVRAFLRAERLDGVLLATQRNFAWLTAGGDSHVVFNTEDGVAWLLWTPEKKYLVAPANEMPRFLAEEVAGLGYEPAEFSWHEDIDAGARAKLIGSLGAGKRIGCDLPQPGTIDIGAKFGTLRAQLEPPEISRYRELARTTAAAVESICQDLKPGKTEQQIQSEVAASLLARDILPTVLLIAADDRIVRYKHAITKDTVVRRELMVTVCARRGGLVVAVTRHVRFAPLDEEIQRRQEAVGRVYAAMLGATRAGATAGSVIAAARAAYADTNFGGLWDAHHLGGAIGYREREYKAAPGSPQLVLDRQAFAWNPTLPGVKSEDTVLLIDDRIEVLTDTGAWPRAKFDAAGRTFLVPQILVK